MIPLVIITVTAFGAAAPSHFPIDSFSTKWFANVFALKSFRRSFLTSLEVAFLATLYRTAGGYAGGLCPGPVNVKGKQMLKSIFLSPTIVPES